MVWTPSVDVRGENVDRLNMAYKRDIYQSVEELPEHDFDTVLTPQKCKH